MKSAEKLLLFSFLCEAVLCGDFSVSLPESVEAVRGLCVLIPCSFEINEGYDAELRRDPTGIWLKDGTDHNKNTVFNSKINRENKIKGELIGDLRMKNCTTVFYNIRRNHSGKYYFRLEASRWLKNTYTPSVCVRVGDSPITPSITLEKEDQGEVEDQNAVVEGTSVSLVCSAPAPPCLLKPPTFSWNFLPEEGRQEQNHNTSFSSSQLTFNATHLHHGLDFTCTATYPLQNKNKSAHSSLTLHVLYAPRVSPISSCKSTPDFFNCSCELSGNPSPILKWCLSGPTVPCSEVISPWKESASNTSLRSFISIPKSLNGTRFLQCVGHNKLDITSQVFPLITAAQCPNVEGLDLLSVLIGAGVAVSVMMMLCGILLCVRKPQNKPPTGQEDTSGVVINDRAVRQKADEESIYANKMVLSASLHYSNIVLPNRAGGEIRGLSKLTTDYAIIHHGSEQETEGGGRETASKEVQEENGTKMNSEKLPEEEATYGNITCQPTMEKTQFELVDNDDDDDDNEENDYDDDDIKFIKETKGAKESDKEQHSH